MGRLSLRTDVAGRGRVRTTITTCRSSRRTSVSGSRTISRSASTRSSTTTATSRHAFASATGPTSRQGVRSRVGRSDCSRSVISEPLRRCPRVVHVQRLRQRRDHDRSGRRDHRRRLLWRSHWGRRELGRHAGQRRSGGRRDRRVELRPARIRVRALDGVRGHPDRPAREPEPRQRAPASGAATRIKLRLIVSGVDSTTERAAMIADACPRSARRRAAAARPRLPIRDRHAPRRSLRVGPGGSGARMVTGLTGRVEPGRRLSPRLDLVRDRRPRRVSADGRRDRGRGRARARPPGSRGGAHLLRACAEGFRGVPDGGSPE